MCVCVCLQHSASVCERLRKGGGTPGTPPTLQQLLRPPHNQWVKLTTSLIRTPSPTPPLTHCCHGNTPSERPPGRCALLLPSTALFTALSLYSSSFSHPSFSSVPPSHHPTLLLSSTFPCLLPQFPGSVLQALEDKGPNTFTLIQFLGGC